MNLQEKMYVGLKLVTIKPSRNLRLLKLSTYSSFLQEQNKLPDYVVFAGQETKEAFLPTNTFIRTLIGRCLL